MTDHLEAGSNVPSLDTAVGYVKDDFSGAIVTFMGTIRKEDQGREVKNLEYQKTPEEGKQHLEELIGQVRKEVPVTKAFVYIRTGKIYVGDSTVVVAVSAKHREQAVKALDLIVKGLKHKICADHDQQFA
ncbi:MoaE-domain-containing protein [Basidiobolus meristosporus CBS 931.73]|uniref:MoaE-domain-containing protein n=1 Tax=Basidiobolus meristosporus CBS 931.73 TaxID=1314790 RepID=A0A1Y1YEW3_9FUNG|nr:MoaE-domain-containing protein [Basidiobolus meristosporus CBS 931.73]|eukprot:ORX96571.1 MoaE-domain-containing protein [Basidiobolus meristosporus CBS 931.73]